MKLSPQTNRKSNPVTWLLAIALFLSCFTFSISTDYAKAADVKTKTELVITATGRVKKTFTVNSFAHYSLQPADLHPSKISYTIKWHNQLSKVHFDFISKNYLTFSSALIYSSFFSRTRENEFSPLIG